VAVSAVLIDLGEDWSVAEEPLVRRRPGAARGPLAALLVVVVLLLVGGSVAARPPFIPLTSIPVQGVTATDVGAGGVFVVVQVSGRRSVTRYALDGGGRTWEAVVPDLPEGVSYLPAAGALVVWSFDDAVAGPARFTVLDATTGRQLWSAVGDLVFGRSPTDRTALVLVEDGSGSTQVRYTDMRSGRAIWSRTVPAMTQMLATDEQTPAEAAGFVLAAADGTVTLVGRQTGEVLATRQFDRLVPAGAPGFDPENNTLLNIVGGRLIVARQMGTPRAGYSSYDLPGLTRRWSRADPGISGYPDACGHNLCVTGFTGDVVALDPADGSTLWRAPGWQGATDIGGGRLLTSRSGGGPRAGILDAATGRLLRDLGDWTPLFGPTDGDLFTAPDPGNYRYTWFGALDRERDVVRPLGRLEGLSTQGCQVYDDLLVCRTLNARLQVWRYRRSPFA
jgi:outer membrane protein assembly factor BamB